MNEHELPSYHLLRWAEPLIGDVITNCYRGMRHQEHRDMQYLVRCQSMLWRALLSGVGNIPTFHKEVARIAFQLGVGENQIEDVNRQVVTELMLVIVSRHARSPRQAAELSVHVAQAYRRLAQIHEHHN